MSPHSKPLPEPTVDLNYAKGEVTLGNVEAMLCNPVYAGIGPFPAIVTDEVWVRAAAKAIAEQGTEQWLVNMLHTLRASMTAVD